MCTLSIIAAGAGHILTMSRDESLVRAEQEPHHELADDGSLRYWHCVDAASGGSWFGVRGDSLVAALLNRYQDGGLRRGALQHHSRGDLVKALVRSAPGTTLNAFEESLDPARYEPFDLYVYQHQALQCLHWDGHALRLEALPLTSPRLFTSSSEQTEAATAYRQQQFATYLRDYPASNAEDIFEHLHRAQSSSEPALAIRMRRLARATRSLCQAQVQVGTLQFRYLPLAN